ncbi:MAG: hypothetical protein WCG66_04485 [bacterium]
MRIPLAIIFFASALTVKLAADDAPWLEQRSMEKFQVLLNRSPFSLPTAEEAAPAADRFFLTGAATINNEPVVFVLDKNSQTRHMLCRTADSSNNQLLDYKPEADPKNMSARIRLDGQEMTVRYAELPSEGQPAQQVPAAQLLHQQPGIPQPPAPGTMQPTTANGSEPPRRVIRRRIISGQPPAAQPVPNQ